jgi:formamidopyrimidine-DNA glycosylase
VPELPEVEIIVQGLGTMRGRTVESIWSSGKSMRLARAIDMPAITRAARGHRVVAVRRRGKYILIDFDGAAGVLVHLGMSGRLRLHGAPEPRAKHTHFMLSLDDGRQMRLVDPRRFGWVSAGTPVDGLPELASLGPDPLTELTAEALAQALLSSRAPVKAFLLDQKRIAGLGNIYVCEALHRARLSPKRTASTIAAKSGAPNERAGKLVDAIKAVLNDAIAAGGSSLRDHRQTSGELGMFQHNFRVYDRAGQRCPTPGCKGTIKRIVQTGRSTYFCPVCQK